MFFLNIYMCIYIYIELYRVSILDLTNHPRDVAVELATIIGLGQQLSFLKQCVHTEGF